MELTYIKMVIIIIITFADGNWTRWSPWSQCSRRCGGGVQTRSRSCTNPQPAFGGSYCDGRSLEKRPCNSQECWGTHITVLPNLLMIMLLFPRANNGCCQGWPGRGAWHELVVLPLSYSLIITRLVFPLRWPLVIKNWSFNYCVCLTPESYPIQRRRQKFPATMVCDKTNSLFYLQSGRGSPRISISAQKYVPTKARTAFGYLRGEITILGIITSFAPLETGDSWECAGQTKNQ